MDSIEKIISEETKNRLEIMGREDYSFPEKIGKRDIYLFCLLILISALLIVLCMVGGIQ